MDSGVSGRAVLPPPFFEQGLKFSDNLQIFRAARGALQLNETLQGDEAAVDAKGGQFFRKRQQRFVRTASSDLAEQIQVTDQELVNHLIAIANQRKIAPKKFIKDLQRGNRIPNIRSSMVIGKAIDFLVEHATVEESTEAKLDA